MGHALGPSVDTQVLRVPTCVLCVMCVLARVANHDLDREHEHGEDREPHGVHVELRACVPRNLGVVGAPVLRARLQHLLRREASRGRARRRGGGGGITACRPVAGRRGRRRGGGRQARHTCTKEAARPVPPARESSLLTATARSENDWLLISAQIFCRSTCRSARENKTGFGGQAATAAREPQLVRSEPCRRRHSATAGYAALFAPRRTGSFSRCAAPRRCPPRARPAAGSRAQQA